MLGRSPLGVTDRHSAHPALSLPVARYNARGKRRFADHQNVCIDRVKLADGLMALFGYPVAQENDIERAP
jgi:hypothetical protein